MTGKIIITTIIFSVLTVFGCGSEPKPMTLQEYAKTICVLENAGDDAETWGDMADALQGAIDAYESVSPPEDVREYHLAVLAGFKSVHESAKGKDADAQANPFELIAEPSMLVLGVAITSAEDSLDADTRAVLVTHGCIAGVVNTPVPVVQNTPVPVSTPTQMVDLANTRQAAMWVSISPGKTGSVRVDPSFDLDRYDLDLFVDGVEFCNTSRIYADEGWYVLGCASMDKWHENIQQVSVQTSRGDLRCGRNFQSDADRSIFACEWR